MVCCCSRLLLSSHTVPPQKLQTLLLNCGLRDIVEKNKHDFAREVTSRTKYQLFAPLFTPYFTIETQHLTMLGDTIIDDYLSRAMLRYAAHAGLVLTMNATRQLSSVLHNHFTLRLFAKELQFSDLAVPLTLDSLTANNNSSNDLGKTCGGGKLSFLEPQHVGLREQDVAGTSFQTTPLRSGQSPLGWMFSHFVGALQQAFGVDAAERVLTHVYGDVDVNLPNSAAALLLRALQHFPAVNVTEAMLAAQGLPLRFVAKSRALPDEEGKDAGRNNNNNMEKDGSGKGAPAGGAAPTGNNKHRKEEKEREEGGVVYTGFGVHDVGRDAVTLDALSADRGVFASLAAGPGGVDAVDIWRRRAQREVGAGSLQEAMRDKTNNGNSGEEGWLNVKERDRYRRGAAFYNSTDFSALNYYADVYGVPQPVNGRRVARVKFRETVRDPLFYDRGSDMRGGVPFATDGEPLAEYLDRFNKTHRRLFEVSLVIGGGDLINSSNSVNSSQPRTAGRATAFKYTLARECACRAYLGAVLHDLQTMREKSSAAI